jgi:hypothetical protein
MDGPIKSGHDSRRAALGESEPDPLVTTIISCTPISERTREVIEIERFPLLDEPENDPQTRAAAARSGSAGSD